eukprot:TRINITY_DN11865_c0_g1_i1.p1 TRINITY_DN11865_c0_g1~~TRINITY_DN11865_c0_g1_i1.p1  ORF type:complete len:196 (-),score=67.51 TRINITY_DN11865_c0_g1_i1:190-753(-)
MGTINKTSMAPNTKSSVEEKKEDLPQEVTVHNVDCNKEFHTRGEVTQSQAKFDWKVVEPYDGKKWVSWDVLGMQVKDDKHKLEWRNCADVTHAWTGLVSLKPGQHEPLHTHTTPMIYYILQGKPIVSLNYIMNRTSKWQCVSIPSECPHSITNDTSEEVVIAWCYVSLKDKVNPSENYNWKWLENIF